MGSGGCSSCELTGGLCGVMVRRVMGKTSHHDYDVTSLPCLNGFRKFSAWCCLWEYG